MKRIIYYSFLIGCAASLSFGYSASAQNPKYATPKPTNYVVFNLIGDCRQEDCMSATKDKLMQGPDFDTDTTIVSVNLESLASHQTVEYKPVKVSFKDLKTQPYKPVIEKLSSLGYKLVSYVIHDTHNGKDVIIPHP